MHKLRGPVKPPPLRSQSTRPVGTPPKIIRVWAANEDIRRIMRHPTGVRFQADISQSVGWPEDAFTLRRLRDGSVLDHPPNGEPEPALVAPTSRGGPGTAAAKPEKK